MRIAQIRRDPQRLPKAVLAFIQSVQKQQQPCPGQQRLRMQFVRRTFQPHRFFIKGKRLGRPSQTLDSEPEIQGRARIGGTQLARLSETRQGLLQVVAQIRLQPIEELCIFGPWIQGKRVLQAAPHRTGRRPWPT